MHFIYTYICIARRPLHFRSRCLGCGVWATERVDGVSDLLVRHWPAQVAHLL